MELGTSVEFDAAHRLGFYKGKCNNIHGHRWRVSINVFRAEYENMVVDFTVLKDFIKDSFDHKILVYEEDFPLMAATDGWVRTVLPFETTAENLALYIKLKIIELIFPTEIDATKMGVMIQVEESPSSSVRI